MSMQLVRIIAVLGSISLPVAVIASSDAPGPASPATAINTAPPAEPQSGQNTSDKRPATRGQLLYENHCTQCHESQVHIRENHKAKSIGDVQGWVAKWQAHQKLGWQTNDILDVTRYLAERYYHFK